MFEWLTRLFTRPAVPEVDEPPTKLPYGGFGLTPTWHGERVVALDACLPSMDPEREILQLEQALFDPRARGLTALRVGGMELDRLAERLPSWSPLPAVRTLSLGALDLLTLPDQGYYQPYAAPNVRWPALHELFPNLEQLDVRGAVALGPLPRITRLRLALDVEFDPPEEVLELDAPVGALDRVETLVLVGLGAANVLRRPDLGALRELTLGYHWRWNQTLIALADRADLLGQLDRLEFVHPNLDTAEGSALVELDELEARLRGPRDRRLHVHGMMLRDFEGQSRDVELRLRAAFQVHEVESCDADFRCPFDHRES